MIIKILPRLLRHRAPILVTNPLGRSFEPFRRSSNKSTKQSAITTRSGTSEVDTEVKPLGEKVKETTRTASYLGIILLGVGVTGTLFYAVFHELFSSKSPNSVYSQAVERCKADVRIQDKLGLPIMAFGMETRRGRRQHVHHVIFQRDGRQCIRMKFNLKGSFHQGTVQLEMVQNDSGDYEYRYLFVEVDDILHNTFILEDNRAKFSGASITSDAPMMDLSI